MLRALAIALTSLQFVTIPTARAAPTTEVTKTDQGSHKDDPVAQPPPADKLPTALISLKSETGTFTPYAFLVDKQQRTLTVWQAEGDRVKLIGAWPTDIGERDGDKLVQGDRRTPEGIYFFQDQMDGRRVNYDLYGARIFTLDYPNYFDRLVKKGGNGIWFHAIPETKSLLRGSRGCVVVRNDVIEELSKFIDLKRTPMLIVHHVEYVEPKRWAEQREQLKTWIENWRQSWMGKDLDKYMAHYSERFNAGGMNKDRWRRYKQTLAGRYKFINVDLQDLQIFNQGSTLVFRFLQDYKSDAKQDFGSKIIYAQNTGETFEIVGENWVAAPPTTPGLSTARTTSEPAPAQAN